MGCFGCHQQMQLLPERGIFFLSRSFYFFIILPLNKLFKETLLATSNRKMTVCARMGHNQPMLIFSFSYETKATTTRKAPLFLGTDWTQLPLVLVPEGVANHQACIPWGYAPCCPRPHQAVPLPGQTLV